MLDENDKANPNISDVKDKLQHTCPWEEYYDVITMTNISVKVEDLSKRMVEWVLGKGDKEKYKREPFRIDDFIACEGMTRDTYYTMMNKHECLKQAHNFTLNHLAGNREYGAATKQYNDATIARTAGWYQPEVRAEQERLAALQKSATPDQRIILELPATPNSNEVKPRQLKNESIDIKVQKD